MNASTQQQNQILSILLGLEKEARKAENLTELAYIMANDTHRLLAYDQAVVWRQLSARRIQIVAISDVVHPDRHALYMQWLTSLITHLNQDNAQPVSIVDKQQLAEHLVKTWQEWQPGNALFCPFPREGGLVLLRETPWQEPETVVLEPLLDAYAHAWRALSTAQKSLWRSARQLLARRGLRLILLVLIILLMFLPVRLSVLAPAEIVPSKPFVVAAPMRGVVETIVVAPNQAVQTDQLLFKLDSTTLQNRYQVAQKTLGVARADYLRASQQMFGDPQAQAEVQFLKAKVDQQAAEVAYSKALLDQAQIRAERAGIAVFADRDDWQGRPVDVGEKVMTLANPEQVEIQIWLSVADAVTLQAGAPVRLFLNTDPDNPIDAELYRSAYVAETRPDQTQAFRLRARLNSDQALPRIGLKGTAKLYGEPVSLLYYLLRRPYAALRQFFGF